MGPDLQAPGAPPGEQTAISNLCTLLHNGKLAAAYQLFTPGYRQSTSLGTFESSVLGHSSSATCTAAGPQAGDATVTLQLADGLTETVQLSLQPATGSSWQFTRVNSVQPR